MKVIFETSPAEALEILQCLNKTTSVRRPEVAEEADDIKDMDELKGQGEPFNTELFARAVELYEWALKHNESMAKQILHKLIKDFEVKPNLSDDMYKVIISRFEAYKENAS